ncbi:MAG: rod shape-determining protein MreD [Acidobacteria bacterium]|nr:rod shape-determining protein MreD [Acidobacteriota bacterium]
MRTLGTLTALALAVVAQAAFRGLEWRGTPTVDLVLVVVVYIALTGGPVAGLLAGTVGGLVQDALSSGILGMGGLAKTVVGFLAGRFGTQFIVTATLPRMFTFAVATAAHAVLFLGAYALLGLRSFPDALTAVALQAAGNAVAGAVGFKLSEWLPRAIERRHARRGMRVSR